MFFFFFQLINYKCIYVTAVGDCCQLGNVLLFIKYKNMNLITLIIDYLLLQSKPGEVTNAVKYAIDIGYRHIDGAHVYGNEKEVGAALKAKIDEGIVKREDLFITSKLWNSYHKPESVERAIKQTLANLGLEYLDLYLIHWPMAYEDGDVLFPTNSDGSSKITDTDYVDTWKGMEGIYEKGLAKNIGISNFNSVQIERILKSCKVKPVTNQVKY